MGADAGGRLAGRPGELTHAPTFFAGLDVVGVDYSPARDGEHNVPFQPSYEDRSGAPDRVLFSLYG